MNADMHRIWEGKRIFRSSLAARPVTEKLAMLDALREMACTIRKASKRNPMIAKNEPPREYMTETRDEGSQ